MADGSAQRLRDEGLDPGAWSNGPGDRYAAHEHGYDKVIVVERGSIRFGLPATAEAIDLDGGRPARAAGRDRATTPSSAVLG